tara:strand:+ start:10244 stop:11296 length:1053 start_codon:yes stop_codon:yes gene_type:complete
MKKILVTGAAGFIGYHLVDKLIKEKFDVYGLDNINDYYDISLKIDRISNHGIIQKNLEDKTIIKSQKFENYTFIKCDLVDSNYILKIFKKFKFNYVINLAAQAGVRYSLENPYAYTSSNVNGFVSVLEACRKYPVEHLLFASTSSVYGLNQKYPFEETSNTDHSLTIYAATKKFNELVAHNYSHLFEIPTTGLRFFTVYGPWGRPDMALFLFVKAILNNKPINVFGYGNMKRDFTYVDDITASISLLLNKAPKVNSKFNLKNPISGESSAPFSVFNIGNNNPVNLMDFINEIEKQLDKKAMKKLLPIQDGDVIETYANVNKLQNLINFKPRTSIKFGVKKFIEWYLKYYK